MAKILWNILKMILTRKIFPIPKLFDAEIVTFMASTIKMLPNLRNLLLKLRNLYFGGSIFVISLILSETNRRTTLKYR